MVKIIIAKTLIRYWKWLLEDHWKTWRMYFFKKKLHTVIISMYNYAYGQGLKCYLQKWKLFCLEQSNCGWSVSFDNVFLNGPFKSKKFQSMWLLFLPTCRNDQNLIKSKTQTPHHKKYKIISSDCTQPLSIKMSV